MTKKFRIWRKDFKRWLTPDDSSLHCQSNWAVDPFTGKVIDWIAMPENHYYPEEEPAFHICDGKLIKESPFVVQQWTGLLDVNGVEIYEGDLLKGIDLFGYDGPYIGTIEYKPCRYYCVVEYPNGGQGGIILDPCEVKEHCLEIVGNIFEKQ